MSQWARKHQAFRLFYVTQIAVIIIIYICILQTQMLEGGEDTEAIAYTRDNTILDLTVLC